VLGLQARTSAPAIQLAVEIAGLLHLDLFGLFLEDVSLRELASIPFAREIRPPGAAWHTIEPDRIAGELNAAIRRTERMFAEAVIQLRTAHEFKVVRGRTADVITSISASDDIIMVVEPVGGAERATQQFFSLKEPSDRLPPFSSFPLGCSERGSRLARLPRRPPIGAAMWQPRSRRPLRTSSPLLKGGQMLTMLLAIPNPSCTST
jgi:hypothetical protein